MTPLASLVKLGAVPSCSNNASISSFRSRRVCYSGAKFRSLNKRGGGISLCMCRCRCSVTATDFVIWRGDSDSEIALYTTPDPVLRPGEEFDDGEKLGDGDRNEVIVSLDGVVEKVETLENSGPGSLDGRIENGFIGRRDSVEIDKSLSVKGTKKKKTLKSVWRKGDSVGTVKKVVKESTKPIKDVKEESEVGNERTVSFKSNSFLNPPQLPVTSRPKISTKPRVASRPAVKRPVFKDVGVQPKLPTSSESESGVKSKDRKPILIDKFSVKKAFGDPLVDWKVMSPKKLGRSPPSGKFKDDYRKKSSSPGGNRRRRFYDDVEIVDEEMPKLNISIPGAARTGKKWSKASRKAARLQAAKEAAPVKVEIMEVGGKGMLIEELAYNLATNEGEILGLLYCKGIKPDGVQTLDKDIVKMICKEYHVEVIDADPIKVEQMAKKKVIFDEEDLEKLEDRPPIITIMGHVDHGKTTLLDFIRKSKIAASEAGGITQGIGAYKVLVPIDGKSQPCVFLDTPGHEAFGAMRARGARVTDIAIIVVAADDGIRSQTREAVAHAKAADVPIVIAINKIDKDGANPDRVMQELSQIGLMPENWGGDIPMVKISALKGENIGELLETLMLVAELQELKANPHRNAKGTVIEAGLHKSKGPLATFIVQNGTLKKGDVVACGGAFGKVRALFDEGGNRVDEAAPSIPVQVIGLNNVPIADDEFEVVGSLDTARGKAEVHAEALRNEHLAAKAEDGKITLSSFTSAVASGKLSGLDLHQLNIILKVDMQGSIEAVRKALQVLPQDNVTLKFLMQATGDVSTSDVDLAVASKAIILGFNVKAPGSIKKYADNKSVDIRLYKVIYELINDVRNAMEGQLETVQESVAIGSAEVRATFSSGSGRVAGCMVMEGKVEKGCGIRVVRKGKIVHVGTIDSLKRVKEMVKEVNAGLECGIGQEDYDDWMVGDIVEAFSMVEKWRTLEEASASMAAALEEAGIEL